MHARDEGKTMRSPRKLDRRSVILGAVAAPFSPWRADRRRSVRAYSIWPENYARPMLEAFEKATGIHVNFIRFSSGEALARLIAEKGNPQVDVLFGGPVETFTAGEEQGIFEAYTPPSAADLPKRFKSAQGMWTAIADDPLVFMTNTKFLQEHNLKAAGLLGRSARSRLQGHAANGRCAHLRHGGDAHLLDPAGQ